jgi:arginine decarboxylase
MAVGRMDRTSVRKAVNRLKATAERRRSPVRRDPETVPLADAMRAYWERDMTSFSIPAHHGGRGPLPEAAAWMGLEAFRHDLPLSHGLDTRSREWKVQATAQELAAEVFGAEQTYFSTNGSSMSVHTAIMSVVGPGDTLVMARNGHKSSFAGLVMSGARPVFVDPDYDEDRELAHGVVPERLAAVLDEHPETKAVMVFTPTYYGVASDVTALADACHSRGLPLVTDDAWGLDYGFHPRLPPSAMAGGADLAIGSVHKSLTGLGQTSVLSVQGNRIDRERLSLCFDLEESTSASALLLSSIDGARRQFARDGERLLGRALDSADRLRAGVEEIDGLDLMTGSEVMKRPGAAGFDPTHVTFDVSPLGMTGYQTDDQLRDEEHVDVELADHRRLMALVTYAHDEADVERLLAALRRLAERGGRESSAVPRIPGPTALRTETVLTPREAFFGPVENVHRRHAAGRIAAEIVTPYPPGIPVLSPGERVTDEVLDYLQTFVTSGGFVEGTTDPTLEHFRVVK